MRVLRTVRTLIALLALGLPWIAGAAAGESVPAPVESPAPRPEVEATAPHAATPVRPAPRLARPRSPPLPRTAGPNAKPATRTAAAHPLTTTRAPGPLALSAPPMGGPHAPPLSRRSTPRAAAAKATTRLTPKPLAAGAPLHAALRAADSPPGTLGGPARFDAKHGGVIQGTGMKHRH